MYSEAKWFLMTLSSKMPIPVSATASLDRGMRLAAAAAAAAWNTASTRSWPNSAKRFWAVRTRATRSSI